MDDQHHANRPMKPSPDSSPRSDTGCNSTITPSTSATTTTTVTNNNIPNAGNNYNHSSNIEVVNNYNNNNGGGGGGANNREQDRFLPIANVGRIMKKAIPSSGKVSKDAKETVQECVSEFISFVTGEASDKCQREKRKTINGDDLIWAITTLGFDDYVNPLKLYLLRYRELEGEKMTMPKQHQADQQQKAQQVPSSTSDSPQSSLMYANQHFSLPFSPNAIQQQQLNDPRAQW
ncbi:hypothetical protein ACLOJK_005860 [Asimina triloba]